MARAVASLPAGNRQAKPVKDAAPLSFECGNRTFGWSFSCVHRLCLTPPDPGRVTARRLNRAEYNHTVRDLLGVDIDPADDFPQDDSGYGFDDIGDALSLSPVLMEKYLSAAENVAREALFGPPALKPTMVRDQPPYRGGIDGGSASRVCHKR